jgi:hypothetical protein
MTKKEKLLNAFNNTGQDGLSIEYLTVLLYGGYSLENRNKLRYYIAWLRRKYNYQIYAIGKSKYIFFR